MDGFITIYRPDGSTTMVRSEEPLTEHEEIINELHKELHKIYSNMPDKLMEAFKEGFSAATDSLNHANVTIQNKK